LLNVFLAIAVDNLGDADDATDQEAGEASERMVEVSVRRILTLNFRS